LGRWKQQELRLTQVLSAMVAVRLPRALMRRHRRRERDRPLLRLLQTWNTRELQPLLRRTLDAHAAASTRERTPQTLIGTSCTDDSANRATTPTPLVECVAQPVTAEQRAYDIWHETVVGIRCRQQQADRRQQRAEADRRNPRALPQQ
jgi:hypothetical protein